VKTPTGHLDGFLERLRVAGLTATRPTRTMRVFVPGEGGAQQLFALAAADRVQVRHLRPSVPTLEDVCARGGEQ
jgi:hypothetical protein